MNKQTSLVSAVEGHSCIFNSFSSSVFISESICCSQVGVQQIFLLSKNIYKKSFWVK